MSFLAAGLLQSMQMARMYITSVIWLHANQHHLKPTPYLISSWCMSGIKHVARYNTLQYFNLLAYMHDYQTQYEKAN